MAESEPLRIGGAYRVIAASREVVQEGRGEVLVAADKLWVTPPVGQPLAVAYRDMVRVSFTDLCIAVGLEDCSTIELCRLGALAEEAWLGIRRFRTGELARAMLIEWASPRESFGAACTLGSDAATLEAEVLLYDRRLALYPDCGDPVVVDYSEVRRVWFDESAYEVRLALTSGTEVRLGRLGRRSLEVPPLLEGLRGEVARQTTEALATLVPGLGPTALRDLADLMRDGHSAPEAEVERVAPGLARALQAARLVDDERMEYLAALRDLSAPGAFRIGTRITAGDPYALGGEPGAEASARQALPIAVWALAPIGATATAYESLTEDDRATYCFRTCGGDDVAELERCLRRVRFLREPIAAAEADLGTVAAGEWATAARRLPELRWLRERFLGRALHTSVEGWSRSLARYAAG